MKTMPTPARTGPGEIHISSLVVQTRPEALDAVSDAIDGFAEAEIHARAEAGKLVVVLETRDETGITTVIDAISGLDGVLTVNMVFHQIDGEAADDADALATGSSTDA